MARIITLPISACCLITLIALSPTLPQHAPNGIQEDAAVVRIPAQPISNDYLLVRPSLNGIEVNATTGNVYVVDEDKVKVFGPNGSAIRLIGRSGHGPGEFDYARSITLSETGYWTVGSGTSMQTLDVFSPTFDWITRINYLNERPYAAVLSQRYGHPEQPYCVYSFGPGERYYQLKAQELSDDYRPTGRSWEFLVQERHGDVELLAVYESTAFIMVGGLAARFPFLGTLLVGYLDGRRIVFSHSGRDVKQTDDGHFYVLTMKSLVDGRETTITRQYSPIPIDDKQISKWKEGASSLRAPNPQAAGTIRQLMTAVDNHFQGVNHKAALVGILTDRNYILAFTYSQRGTNELLTDVFDADTASYLGSWYFPGFCDDDLSIVAIKNGFAYILADYQDDSIDEPHIDKFKVDPRVYGITNQGY